MSTESFKRDFPVKYERDVVVCGGGTAGATAAIAAARNGAKVLILESSGALGGTATNGGVTTIHGFRRHENSAGAEQVVFGMAQEFHDRLVDIGGVVGKKGEANKEASYPFDPELFKLLLEEMCAESGVEILYGTYIVDAIVDGGAVQGVTFVNKSGTGAVKAKITIDCTGDADVAASAGAEVVKGRINGKPMPLTLSFIMGNLDFAEFQKRFKKHGTKNTVMTYLRKAREAGDLSVAEGAENFGYFGIMPVVREGSQRMDEGWFNSDMVYDTDTTDAEQMTQAWLKGRKRMYEIARFARKYLPGCENAYVQYTFPMMGIRDSRVVIGDYILTDDDFYEARKHPDVIGRSGRAMNVHPPEGLPPDAESHFGRPPFWTETKIPFEIPYRILLPKGLENLLVAGRCISAQGLIQGSMRGEPQCMVTGQGAGTGAAVAIRDGVTPRQADIKKVQTILKEQGARWE